MESERIKVSLVLEKPGIGGSVGENEDDFPTYHPKDFFQWKEKFEQKPLDS